MSAASGVTKLARFEPYFCESTVTSEDKFQEFINLLDQTPDLTADEKCQIFNRLALQSDRLASSTLEKIKNAGFSRGLAMDSSNHFILEERLQEFSQKEAVRWKCISKHPSKTGTYLYTFQYQPTITYAPWPAVEPFISDKDPYKISTSEPFRRFFNSSMSFLGYSVEVRGDESRLTFPDRDTLLTQWKQLQQTIDYLPPLYIVLSEGIATNQEFLEVFYSHLDGPALILSTGKEFLHDHYTHIAAVINNLLSKKKISKQYQKQFIENQRFVQKTHTKIKNLREELGNGNPPLSLSIQASTYFETKEITITYDNTMLTACEEGLSAACDFYTGQFYVNATAYVGQRHQFNSIEKLLSSSIFSVLDNWWEHFKWEPLKTKEYQYGMNALINILSGS